MLFHSCTSVPCHAAAVVFPVDFDGGEHVYRVHRINVQLVTNPMIMPAKEEHGYDSGSESLVKHEPRDILLCHVERRDQSFAVAEKAERYDQEYCLCILRHSIFLELF